MRISDWSSDVCSSDRGMTVRGMLVHEDGTYCFVTVTNRGSTPTTVTHLVAHEYANWWKRWRRSACATYYITDPPLPGSSIGQMPSVLETGRQWQAAFDADAKAREWLDSGRFYVAISATHATAPALTRVQRTTVEAASPKPRGAATP